MAKNPRSIRDSDSAQAARARKVRSARSRQVRKVAAIAAVSVAVAGLGYGAFQVVSSAAQSAGASDLTVKEDQQGRTVQILIDGWSAKTLEGRELSAQWAGKSASALKLEPVSGADLKELLRTSPELVQAALARQLNGSTTLTCDTGGCSADGASISADDLLLGGSSDSALRLRGLGITSGLYKALVPVPDGGSQLSITAAGYSPIELLAGGLYEAQDVAGEEGSGGPSLSNGFEQDRWLLSAGLGQFFTPDAAWLGAPEERAATAGTPTGATPEDAVGLLTAQAPDFVAATGLGAPLGAAERWTASQLTLATSPSKGCTAGVLCFPGTLEVAQDVTPAQFVPVASPTTTGVAVFDDRRVTVDLPAPIFQSGIAEPVQGAVTLRMVTVALHGGQDVTPVDWAGLVEVGDEGAYSPADALAAVRLAGEQWSMR